MLSWTIISYSSLIETSKVNQRFQEPISLDDKPVRIQYRHPEESKSVMAEVVQNMLDCEVIEESTAVNMSPIDELV